MVVRPRMVGGLFCNFKPTRCTADIQTARTPDSLIALIPETRLISVDMNDTFPDF
jgi:hypothetical protein